MQAHFKKSTGRVSARNLLCMAALPLMLNLGACATANDGAGAAANAAQIHARVVMRDLSGAERLERNERLSERPSERSSERSPRSAP